MAQSWSDVSKEVGWDARNVSYPTLQEVEICDDAYTVLSWNRFLPSPQSDDEVEIMNAIVKKLSKIRSEL